jgi:hypothetical protein
MRVRLWVEPFAGSLAVGLGLLGGTPLVGWMGSKARYADGIKRILRVDSAEEVWCADVNDWAQVWRGLARPGVAADAADIIEGYEAQAMALGGRPMDYRAVWMALRDDWRREGTPADGRGVARWLALVKGSAAGKGPDAGTKFTDTAEARRLPNGSRHHDRFDSVAPRLRALRSPLPIRVWDDAAAIPARRDAVVLIDPPYAGLTGYAGSDGRSRSLADVVVEKWREAGATVALCEATPTPGGVVYDLGARGERLASRRAGKNGKLTPEWLTVFGRPTSHPSLWDGVAADAELMMREVG